MRSTLSCAGNGVAGFFVAIAQPGTNLQGSAVTDSRERGGHRYARSAWSRICKNPGEKSVSHQWVMRGGIRTAFHNRAVHIGIHFRRSRHTRCVRLKTPPHSIAVL